MIFQRPAKNRLDELPICDVIRLLLERRIGEVSNGPTLNRSRYVRSVRFAANRDDERTRAQGYFGAVSWLTFSWAFIAIMRL